MGWLSSLFGSGSGTDPVEKLDPKLRAFLERESPVKYEPKQSPPASVVQPSPSPTTTTTTTTTEKEPEPEKRLVPSESLYQDGRYAHLWKSYRPLSQLELENATDHDRMAAVLEGYKDRKAALAHAALENCALQQEEWVNCMKDGSWEDRLQMCRHQRFLRAMGYGSILGRSAEIDESIQMHADALYQRMINHEAAVEQAKKNGTPIPVFEIIVPKSTTTTTSSSSSSSTSTSSPSNQEDEQAWAHKLQHLPEAERAIEAAALRADFRAKADVASTVKELRRSQKEGREARLAEGKGTFFDSLAGLLSAEKK
ncbi:hypothetical protein L249_0226 [Ophiocordyceps polyrhachis-furcata BCC 54312]|uniref:Autophagy-related protein 6 n=1 Tax=Ophiocordyceps polyrhachis-furcata BCC 54312 TaxID=1330021 RepID=A0A367LFS0_9HYPO|nr:hypothetical protein L249_0226 [Ophiocordyceps polyrhachis-furcata BCC 54312]